MNTQVIVNILLGLLQSFWGSNPTVEDIELVLPQIMTAISNAKAGQAFSIGFPLAVDKIGGAASFGWSPNQQEPAARPA